MKFVFRHKAHLSDQLRFAKGGAGGYTSEKEVESDMTDLPGIVITGASGRMGQMLIKTVMASDKARLVGALERPGHDWIGRDAGEVAGAGHAGVPITDDAVEAFAKAQAVIDFTAPAATVEFAALAAQARAVHVIGTTGMSEDEIAKLGPAARHAVIIRAGNMSLGVNLLTTLTKKVAEALGMDYDIEVIEAHHHHKVDAPSGTALMLGQAAADGLGVDLNEVADRGRDGITGARTRGHIGFHAIRGGDIIGEHDVLFAGPGERITLRHVASDRSVFANGALRAALWGQDKSPGEYDMVDVLGL
ncbi:4-hydroxy-tetrahydrodipicolinate reductase [Actibacterium pelagium]|uniref:4-hydroxy-tetrahydrodipicolinate reductase n=2 Tax=Actibacterium pelagium TaxID=2029103 RepID=A0A917AHK3_9RHOB|nr:4-hydroxy-tetrahydrodipicolinate reductase [Actibacterium pelagium]